jgi:hypothetical protein
MTNATKRNEVNPELVKAIERLLPGCPGLAEATVRIYLIHVRADRLKQQNSDGVRALHYEIHESPEGRICASPRVVTVLK